MGRASKFYTLASKCWIEVCCGAVFCICLQINLFVVNGDVGVFQTIGGHLGDNVGLG